MHHGLLEHEGFGGVNKICVGPSLILSRGMEKGAVDYLIRLPLSGRDGA